MISEGPGRRDGLGGDSSGTHDIGHSGLSHDYHMTKHTVHPQLPGGLQGPQWIHDP